MSSSAHIQMQAFVAKCLKPNDVKANISGYKGADKDRAMYAKIYEEKCITKAPSRCFTSPSEVYFCDRDIPSHYNRGTETVESKWDACALRCWKDEGCRGWTWYPSGTCQLKTNGEKSVMQYQKDAWSGPRRDMSVGGGGTVGAGGASGGGIESSSSQATTPAPATEAPIPASSADSFLKKSIIPGVPMWVVLLNCGASMMIACVFMVMMMMM